MQESITNGKYIVKLQTAPGRDEETGLCSFGASGTVYMHTNYSHIQFHNLRIIHIPGLLSFLD